MTESEKDLYTRLVALIQHHSGAGYIYAAPDCPEVYFLAGMHNPTRKIYEFLGDSENEPGIISTLLERKGVETVVINRRPRFSDKMNSEIVMLLKERFPKSLDLGQFTVRWKN